MSSKSSDQFLISFCGLNCAACDINQAYLGNEMIRNGIVEWFRKERNETIKPEQVRCGGCRGPLGIHWSEDCKMMLCARKKGVEYCFECSEFPCKILGDFASDGMPHHKRTVENLKKMKEIGINAWIAEQRKKGQCLFCP